MFVQTFWNYSNWVVAYRKNISMDDQNQKALSLIPFPDVTGSSIPTLTSLINSCTQPDYSPLIPPASELLEIRKDLQIIQSAAISRERV